MSSLRKCFLFSSYSLMGYTLMATTSLTNKVQVTRWNLHDLPISLTPVPSRELPMIGELWEKCLQQSLFRHSLLVPSIFKLQTFLQLPRPLESCLCFLTETLVNPAGLHHKDYTAWWVMYINRGHAEGILSVYCKVFSSKMEAGSWI